MGHSTASRPSTASATATASNGGKPGAADGLLRGLSRIWIRLLAFNVLLVFLPASGLLYLDTYEEELLKAQENAMAQEGRLLAAALSGETILREEKAQRILLRLNRQFTSRLRVVDPAGNVLADSARLGPRREPGEAEAVAASQPSGTRDSWTYRLGRVLYLFFQRLRGGSEPSYGAETVPPADLLERPEIQRGLSGEYGAASRAAEGQRSLTLSSVLPVFTSFEDAAGEVAGVVLVSRSTSRILDSLDLVRLKVFQVFLASVVAAVVLSLLLATTIARPLRRLQREAGDLLDRRGRLKGRFGGSRRRDEIGDLARALEELSARLEEHLGFTESFAADVAHELKNPLASIRSAAELIGEAEEPADRARFARLIQGQVARMEHLLSSARELTHIDAQLEQEERTEVRLAPLLEDIVAGYRLRWGGKAGQAAPIFLLETPEGEGSAAGLAVKASPERLTQVVDHLVDNAVSFSPPGGEVTLRLAAEDGRAVLEVADRGPGLPEEHLEKVFRRFFTYRPGQAATARRDDHAGLGLAVVRTLAEGYGGRVTARNREGGGALFRVELPRLSG